MVNRDYIMHHVLQRYYETVKHLLRYLVSVVIRIRYNKLHH